MKNSNGYLRRILLWGLILFCTAGLILSPAGSIQAKAAAKNPSINKTKATLYTGDKLTLEIRNADYRVTWKTSNKSVVKIKSTSGSRRQKAVITAVKNGKAVVSAKVGSKTFKATITVKTAKTVKLTTKAKKTTVNEGDLLRLQVLNPSSKVTWSTSDKSVVKIKSTSGSKKETAFVQAGFDGKATVTAKVGSTKMKITVTVKHVHKWSPATCTAPQTCKVCGKTKGSTLPHEWSAAKCTEPARCIRCRTTQPGSVPLGHDMTAATCQESAKCRRCDFDSGEFAPHAYNANGFCTTPGCDEMDLNYWLVMFITNSNEQNDRQFIKLGIVNYMPARVIIGDRTQARPYTGNFYPTGRGSSAPAETGLLLLDGSAGTNTITVAGAAADGTPTMGIIPWSNRGMQIISRDAELEFDIMYSVWRDDLNRTVDYRYRVVVNTATTRDQNGNPAGTASFTRIR